MAAIKTNTNKDSMITTYPEIFFRDNSDTIWFSLTYLGNRYQCEIGATVTIIAPASMGIR